MIAIFSKSRFEGTTDEVIDWLFHYKANYVRINGSDYFEAASIWDSKNITLESRVSSIKVCWFRRWLDDDFFKEMLRGAEIQYNNLVTLENHVHREFILLSNELWRHLNDKIWITKPSEVAIKKLEVLERAAKVGLHVPPTLITTQKVKLKEFKSLHKRIISKTVGDIPNFRVNKTSYSIKTVEIEDDFIEDSLGQVFFPSLFQALIEKEYEIRVFFLNNKLYSMAIFSQNDKQTELDFRNYNRNKPNRVVRYKLPQTIEDKLLVLISDLKLTCGSIDIIKDSKTKDYYFLEINPVGQIGMTSYPCNYYLEREIAKLLIKYDE